MNGIDQAKAAARKTALAARKTAHAAGQGQAAALLADWLAAHAHKTLAGYIPIRTEIDPLPAMAAHPGPVGVPVITGAARPLRFREWSPGATMVPGEFGAAIPAEGAWLDPGILIVPLLAFDARGNRLGYGGGFYDRTLQTLRARRPTLAIGFAFAAQELPSLPVELTDQKLDAIITESGVLTF